MLENTNITMIKSIVDGLCTFLSQQMIFQSLDLKESKTLLIPVQKETMKNNGQWYQYTAYEYNGEIYYSIIYSGIADESEFD